MKKLLAILIVALAASVAMAEDLTFEWSQADDTADGFYIYRSIIDGIYNQSDRIDASAAACNPAPTPPAVNCSFTWANLTMLQRTFFVATAFDAGGESGYSNQVFADPAPVGPPPPPGSFRITIQVSSGG